MRLINPVDARRRAQGIATGRANRTTVQSATVVWPPVSGAAVLDDPATASRLLVGMEPLDELLRQSGQFGPKVAVPDDADVRTTMLGLIGRDPAWTPTGHVGPWLMPRMPYDAVRVRPWPEPRAGCCNPRAFGGLSARKEHPRAGGRTMTTSTSAPLSHRDRAVLRAVAAGRCALAGPTLLVDGLCCADQFLCARLTGAGLIDRAGLNLTAAGRAALDGS